MNQNEHLIESKTTTQRAPLELLLTWLRTRKILPYVEAGVVLDFGCGAHLRTLRAVGNNASQRFGIDSWYKDQQPTTVADGITVVGSFTDLRTVLSKKNLKLNRILSLACFEHIETVDLIGILKELAAVATDDALLIGTVPTPAAKPVLEFLSYRLGLIDRTQIEDHKVYYNQDTLRSAFKGTGWEMTDYRTFQFGWNSFFVFGKSPK